MYSYYWRDRTPKIIVWDLSTETEKECTYSKSFWGTRNIGETIGSYYGYSNGTLEINRNGNYMVSYFYDWWDKNKRGFYKYNLNPGLNCPDKSNDQFISFRIVSELMILANEKLSEYTIDNSIPSIYRSQVKSDYLEILELPTTPKVVFYKNCPFWKCFPWV